MINMEQELCPTCGKPMIYKDCGVSVELGIAMLEYKCPGCTARTSMVSLNRVLRDVINRAFAIKPCPDCCDQSTPQ
jgi:hypothetical protein